MRKNFDNETLAEIQRLEKEINQARERLAELTQDTFSTRLREERKQQGITAERMAMLLGMTRVGYGHYERGQRDPSLESLIKIADFLNVSVDWLLGRTDKKEFTEAEQ